MHQTEIEQTTKRYFDLVLGETLTYESLQKSDPSIPDMKDMILSEPSVPISYLTDDSEESDIENSQILKLKKVYTQVSLIQELGLPSLLSQQSLDTNTKAYDHHRPLIDTAQWNNLLSDLSAGSETNSIDAFKQTFKAWGHNWHNYRNQVLRFLKNK